MDILEKISRIILMGDKGGFMKIGGKSVTIFKMKNRKGYAAICDDHLTEGITQDQAIDRMEKAVNRTMKKLLRQKKN